MHSVPKQNSKDGNELSRHEMLSEDDPAKALPEIDVFMANIFESIGLFLNGGMGMIPITWSEMDSFLKCSKYELTGWEAEHIIKMSRAYCSMVNQGKEIGCPSPYNLAANDKSALERNRVIVADKFKQMKRNRAGFKGK